MSPLPSRATLPILTVLALASACSKPPAPSNASATAPAAAPAAPPTLPPAMPSHQRALPDAATPAAPADSARSAPTATATGKVIETMDAGGYTYVQLDTGKEKIWAATAPITVKVGQVLTVPLEMPMENFHSARLGRDFPLIYFASRVSRGNAPPPPGPAMPPGHPVVGQTMPPGHPPVGAGSKSPMTVTEVIPPAAGGLSVAELWTKRTSLAGKTVVVRGKVVKFLSGIMGRNWVHLQDGTGQAKDGSNDITVTTDSDAKPGDIVTATGTLAIDRDFGAGYRYGAIIESATLAKAAGS